MRPFEVFEVCSEPRRALFSSLFPWCSLVNYLVCRIAFALVSASSEFLPHKISIVFKSTLKLELPHSISNSHFLWEDLQSFLFLWTASLKKALSNCSGHWTMVVASSLLRLPLT